MTYVLTDKGGDELEVSLALVETGGTVTATGWVSALTHYVAAEGDEPRQATTEEAQAYADELMRAQHPELFPAAEGKPLTF